MQSRESNQLSFQAPITVTGKSGLVINDSTQESRFKNTMVKSVANIQAEVRRKNETTIADVI